METDALITAFRRLRTNDSRREAIIALVNELTPHEWRALHGITAARTFQFDIIGQLPVELVAQVFTHLDTSTPYRLQRVSRQWRHVLQSSVILSKSLCSWYGNTLNLQGAEYSLLERKAKHIHAFRQGDPKYRFKIDLNDPHGYVTLVEDTLVWSKVSRLDHTARTIYLFNISTWNLQTLHGDARERVERLFASDKLVGFATNGTVCYVWSLESREKRLFRVPHPALFQSVTCRGNTVACAACVDNYALVYIWDYCTQRGRSFTISYDSPLLAYPTIRCKHRHGLALLLQPDDEHIVVFADERCATHYLHKANMSTTVRYSRYRYTGECVAESEVTLDLVPASIHMLDNQLTPVDHKGAFRMTMSPSACLQFDENLFEFTEPRPAALQGELWANDTVYWWSDVLFELRHSEAGTGANPILVHMGTRPKFKPLTAQKPPHRPVVSDHETSIVDRHERVFLNDRYVVQARTKSFEVLCFGENLKHRQQSGAFFNIGSFRVINGIE